MIKCTKCGTLLEDSAKFCSKCGAPITVQPNTEEAIKIGNHTVSLTPKQKKICKIGAIAVGVVLLFVIMSSLMGAGHCKYSGCDNAAAEKSDYCYNHKCNYCDEAKTTLSSKYCYLHYKLYDEEAQAASYNATSDLKFSNISVTHNSSYTVVTGTVTNKGSHTYSFVKIKGAFKNSSGTVLDTDWTYAVGSEGLSSGESTTFRMSVTKNRSITGCSISITDYN